MLQLAERSRVKTKGVIEDLLITTDSCDYHVDFVVLKPNICLGGYPLILGRPWLAIIDAFISCGLGNMTISIGDKTKQMVLYPLAQTRADSKQYVWPTLEEDEQYSLDMLIMIERNPMMESRNEDVVLTIII